MLNIDQYRCKHFKLHELVPRETFEKRGNKAWELIDVRVLITIDNLRERYGSMTINNWSWGGDREWSGLRTPDSPWYSTYSQHTYGRAADCIFQDTTAELVRQDILADKNHSDFELINSLELGTSWLHFDVRNSDRIKTFTP